MVCEGLCVLLGVPVTLADCACVSDGVTVPLRLVVSVGDRVPVGVRLPLEVTVCVCDCVEVALVLAVCVSVALDDRDIVSDGVDVGERLVPCVELPVPLGVAVALRVRVPD